ELADRTRALLGTTLRTNGLFAGHPWNVGIVGGFARPTHERLVRDADVVLAVGASLNQYTTDHGRAFGTDQVVRIDASSNPPEPTCPVALSITGDARDVLAGLLDALKPRNDDGYRTPTVMAALRDDRVVPPTGSGQLDATALSRLVDHQLPTN